MRDVAERVRKFVEVEARFAADGAVTPLAVVWEGGRRYEIDRVLDRRQARSLKAGGAGMRYTVRVGGSTTYLFYDDHAGAWFVEAKVAPM